MSNTLPYELLARYVAEECSADERLTVEQTFQEDSEFRRLLEELTQARNGLRVQEAPIDTERMVQLVSDRIRRDRSLASPSLLGAKHPNRDNAVWLRRPLRLHLQPAWRWTATAMAAVIVAMVVWTGIRVGRAESKSVTRTYTTTTGQRAIVTLDDGTRVTLAPRSTLRLSRFRESLRTVTLDGEAYFEVTSSRGAPFIVRTGSILTRVLGTTFFVRHYAAEPRVRVVVTAGKVSVASQSQNRPSIIVTGGRIGEVSDSLATVLDNDTSAAEIGWLGDELVFHKASMPEVLATLSRWYGYQFRVADPALSQQTITAGLSTQSATEALSTLRLILNVDLTQVGDTITLSSRRVSAPRAPRRLDTQKTLMPLREVGR